ncbi:alpha/beta hydrolase [Streptomyces sp. bgisy027]|uniref:alpha/beta hydrolase n=1 Tax=Streptomyces sp. bgisy027 TaxID=3413770 RepID=UPI003D708AB0
MRSPSRLCGSGTIRCGRPSIHGRSKSASSLVTVLGGVGHGIYGSKSCADRTATAYPTTGKPPSKDATCKAAPAARERANSLPLPTPRGGVPR